MKKMLSVFMCLLTVFGLSAKASAFTDAQLDNILNDTAEYLYTNVSSPQVGSIGGEWCVLGLARSEIPARDNYFENYYRSVESYVKEHNGILHDKKYTEYSRVILALTSIGKNPSNVGGYNLLTPLSDFEGTVRQGINGPVWVLIALDSASYEIPNNDTITATRQMYINSILENELPSGGWSLSSDTADVDITAMALQALSKYQADENVKAATENALARMSELQNENGGFSSWGYENSESCAQMLTALCELCIPISDPRFVKGQNTLLDNLLTYYEHAKGFKHTKDGTTNQMATEQCFYALVSLKRFNEGKHSLYNMHDVLLPSSNTDQGFGLVGKSSDVKKTSLTFPGKTFDDIKGHSNQAAIEALSERSIISGRNESLFDPNNTMTRAEFAAITVRALGLPNKTGGSFTDISASDWFYDLVSTAYSYGIVNGISSDEFNPNGIITREEAAVMISRAAGLCGMDTNIQDFDARNTLAAFIDYTSISDWAFSSLAFCFDNKLLSEEALEIKPQKAVTRAEIAQILFNVLSSSKLI